MKTKTIVGKKGSISKKKTKTPGSKLSSPGIMTRRQTRSKRRAEERRVKMQRSYDKISAPHYADEAEANLQKRHEDVERKYQEQLKAARQSTRGRKSKRTEMLAALAKNISAKGEIAEDRLLNKSDKLIDIATTYIDTEVRESGLPMIMGIEMITMLITGIIDIIPIPEIGVIGEAVEGASDALVSGITAIGPTSLTDMIETRVLPLLVKFATIFQGIAASFSCCPAKNRAPGIKLDTKLSLKQNMKKLESLLNLVQRELKGKPNSKIPLNAISVALTNVRSAEKNIGPVQKQGAVHKGKTRKRRGGRRKRRTRRY